MGTKADVAAVCANKLWEGSDVTPEHKNASAKHSEHKHAGSALIPPYKSLNTALEEP